MTKKWNTTRFAVFGFVLGAVCMEFVMFRHPDAVLSRMPTASAMFAGLIGLLIFGGAAVSCNRFVRSPAREAQKAQAKNWNATRFIGFGFLLGAAFVESVIFLHLGAGLSRIPIIAAIFGGLMGALACGAAAVSRNRLVRSMSKWTG